MISKRIVIPDLIRDLSVEDGRMEWWNSGWVESREQNRGLRYIDL